MSYLTIKIISLVIGVVIMLVVLANHNDKEDKEKAVNDAPDDAFQTWLKQASIYDIQKMLVTTLVKVEPRYYKADVYVNSNDFQSRMKFLFETLPKNLRSDIYPDEAMLWDYIQGSIEENPDLPTPHKKRDDLYRYFKDNLSKGELFENELFLKVMFLDNSEKEKPMEIVEDNNHGNEAGKNIDQKAVHNEMYYVEYKLIPHLVELYNEQPDKASQIVITIYENLVTLLNHLRKINPFAFGKIDCEVCGNIENECLIVYTFPKPLDMPLAKYGAVYFNLSQRKYKYWTLELSLNETKYVLGSMNEERHENYGQRQDMTKEEFIHEVCHVMGVDENTLQPRNKISRKHVIEMNDYSFDDAITHCSPIVVCFYDYQQPSETFISVLEQVAQEYQQQVAVGIYDVYGGMENTTAASENNITALPTLLFFKDGKQVNRHIGICNQEDLKKMFEELL